MKKSLIIGGIVVVVFGVGLVKLRNTLVETIMEDWLDRCKPEGFKDPIIVGTRNEAKSVVDSLLNLITDYGVASVADLKDLTGFTATYKDNSHGWKELKTKDTRIERTRYGYVLILPKTIILE
jgi:hypothetical protein